jgi:hypothetical protein
MTPDEHYIRAEQLAGQAAGTFQMIVDASAERPIDADIRAAWYAEMGVLARLAQVHATLATRTAPAPSYPPPAAPANAPYPPGPYPGQAPPAWAPPAYGDPGPAEG